MSARKNGDTPDVAFTLEQLEQEAVPDLPPLRMSVRGKILELQSPMAMPAAEMTAVLDAISESKVLGEMGEAAAMIKLLPAMIGEDNYKILLDAKISMAALMKLQEKVEAYYEQAFEAAGVDDPKGSPSPSA